MRWIVCLKFHSDFGTYISDYIIFEPDVVAAEAHAVHLMEQYHAVKVMSVDLLDV